MTENYKILGKYIKDCSSETPNIETYLFVKDQISKYNLNIDITSKALKNKLIEINTTMKFEDKEPIISVAKPGMINNIAANAIAAPEINSYAGT